VCLDQRRRLGTLRARDTEPFPDVGLQAAHNKKDATISARPLTPTHFPLFTMPPESNSFTALNLPANSIPEWMGSFSLAAPPNSDLWRKPPARDTSTAPVLYTTLRRPFVAAEVTVSADWELEWDQAGLVIFAGTPPGRSSTAGPQQGSSTVTSRPISAVAASETTAAATAPSAQGTAPPPYQAPAACSKWVKVAMEFTNNALHASSVCATTDGADWSVSSLTPEHNQRAEMRVKMERIGYALWVWYEDELGTWKKLREVTWFFWGVEDKAVRVGVYASRPANFAPTMYDQRHNTPNTTGRNLFVRFDGLEIY